jgi:hypothetical protein
MRVLKDFRVFGGGGVIEKPNVNDLRLLRYRFLYAVGIKVLAAGSHIYE